VDKEQRRSMNGTIPLLARRQIPDLVLHEANSCLHDFEEGVSRQMCNKRMVKVKFEQLQE
jgi:hypothetical protein